MLEAEKWSEGKPRDVAFLSRLFAFSADAICKLVQDFYDGGTFAHYLKFPSLEEWHDYYRNSEDIAEIYECFSPNHFLSESTSSFEQEVNDKEPASNSDGSDELSDMLDVYEELYRSLNKPAADMNADDSLKSYPSRDPADYSDPRANFYFSVATICDAFYGEDIGSLFNKACCGNYESLEKILRLDESLISEPSIAAQVFQLKAEGKKNKYSKLLGCLGKRPKLKFTLQKIKYVKAGHISAYSELMGHKLTEPDIRALFDAISRDRGKGPIDIDLPDSAEAFSKAIQRERMIWLENSDYPDT